MYQFRLDEHNVHRSAFHSLRIQLAITLAASLAIPLAIFAILRPNAFYFASTYITSALAVVGSVTTLLVLRRVGGFFGLAITRWILPVYLTTFGSLASVLIFLRVPYSSILLGISLAFSLLSFFVLTSLMARGRRATCYVIPVGRAAQLEFTSSLRTIYLHQPRLPAERNAIIVADLHASLGEEWERLITEAALRDCPVYHVTQLREAMTGMVQFDHLSENSFGALIPTLAYKKIKRLIDIASAVILLPLLLPFMVLVALAIKLDSPGPALFVQRRMGYRGQMFKMFKFRTMTVTENGEDSRASVTASNDHRITRIGRFLRPTRIDELPQVFNIIAGQMSWIGPRPEAVSLSHEYATQIPNYRYRHLVRPGLSGWAQVQQGHVTTVDDISDKLRYDFYYVKNISLWIDIVIALRTIGVVFTGYGAK